MSARLSEHPEDTAMRVTVMDLPSPHPLLQRARRLWPDSIEMQARWMKAVAVVRKTRRGWLLDNPHGRLQ